MKNIITENKLNIITMEGIVTDINNPILNASIIVIKDLDGISAFNLVSNILDKFTHTNVGKHGIIILTKDGKRFGYYSNLDNSLTVNGEFSHLVTGKTSIQENSTNTSPQSNTMNTLVVQNETQYIEDKNTERHYYDNYNKYNSNITVTDLDESRKQYQGTVFNVKQYEGALLNIGTPTDIQSEQVKQDALIKEAVSFMSPNYTEPKRILTVDGACSGNPGTFEFRMVWEDDKTVLNSKHYGELIGTNNIAEVLGLCTAIHYVIFNNLYDTVAIKYDSVTAKAWIDKGAHKITSTKVSPEAIQAVNNALAYINANRELVNRVELIKHDTKAEGEIAADFGNKSGK